MWKADMEVSGQQAYFKSRAKSHQLRFPVVNLKSGFGGEKKMTESYFFMEAYFMNGKKLRKL